MERINTHNSLDGEIVLWTKRTLLQYPRLSVALYEALVWRNVFTYLVLFAGTVAAVKLVLVLVSALAPVPLALVAAGTSLLYSALADSLAQMQKNQGQQEEQERAKKPLPSDPLSKEAYNAYIALAYSAQRQWDGIQQQRSLHRAMFTLQLLLVVFVLSVVLPLVRLDAVVWLLVLALLVAPGVYSCWIAPQRQQPHHQDQGDAVGPAPRRSLPRANCATLPNNFRLSDHK